MANILQKDYETYTEINARYATAKCCKDDTALENARADFDRLKSEIESRGKTYEVIFANFRESKDNGNEFLDWSDGLRDKDVKDFVDGLREYGIEKFTFSSGWSNAVEIAWLFLENGCTLEGMTQINGLIAFFNGEHKKQPAYVFAVH